MAKLSRKELKSYIEDQLDSGITIGHITDHLTQYGHSRDELEPLFDEILDEEEVKKRGFAKKAAEAVFIVLFVIFIFWVGISSNSPGEAIFIGFLPTIAFVVIVMLFIKRVKNELLMALPILLAFLFYISGTLSNIPVFVNMEAAKLTLLNVILSYIFVLFMQYSSLLSSMKLPLLEEKEITERLEETEYEKLKKEIVQEPKKEEFIQIPEKHEPLKRVIHSIESNCKAINSVIGRVYRKSNGGTTLVRELIQVKSSWYNAFNHLLRDMSHKKPIYDVVDKIEKRLNVLFRKEHEVFSTIQFRNLRRDPNGNTRIIDVLIMNDNDPVQSYFENALSACGEAKDIIGSVEKI